MKKIIAILSFVVLYSCGSSEPNPCVISEGFIKKELKYPLTADFSAFDCSTEKNADGSFTILRKVAAKNSFGVPSEIIYKVTLQYNGGEWTEEKNWSLLRIQSEQYK